MTIIDNGGIENLVYSQKKKSYAIVCGGILKITWVGHIGVTKEIVQ